jgi:hypothetical protein
MKVMKNKLKAILKWILYIVIPLLFLKMVFHILYKVAGDLPFQLIVFLGSSQQELIFTQLQEVFFFKVSFILCLSIFFTVLICSVYMLVESKISFIKSLLCNFAASILGLAVGVLVLYIKIGNKPFESLEGIHPELVPTFGFLSMILMSAILIIKSKRANHCVDSGPGKR